MVDRTVTQEAILAEETEFKVRVHGQTDYAVLNDVIDDTVRFSPEGNDARKFTAISGKSFETPGKIQSLTAPFPLWLTTNELEILTSVFGEPVTTGSAPYTHTFTLSTIGQDVDFVITGPRYGSTTEECVITGTSATMRLVGLGIEKGGLWKFECEIIVSAANCTVAVVSDTNIDLH